MFSPKLAELQNHVLWFYNNSIFAEKDFKNIIRLGARHKSKKSGVIGKFSLGFNAVYNITDLPSILSDRKLAIFDPNMKFLPEKFLPNPSQPGVLFNLSTQNFISSIDQFKPYKGIFGCNSFDESQNNFLRTLFRLPFRKTVSELSNKLYTIDRAKRMMNILFENAENMLFYTQNICKLKVYILLDEKMEQICSIEKSCVKIIRNFGIDFPLTPFCNDENRELIRNSNILTLAGRLIDYK